MIKKYVQGENDKDLFGLIGSWLIDKKVHDELGIHVTGQDGDIWHVCLGQDGEPLGFAQMHVFKNKNAHLRYLYCKKDVSKERLVDAAIKMAKDTAMHSIYTYDRESATIWKKMGFKKKEKKTGSFCKWEKIMEEPKKRSNKK